MKNPTDPFWIKFKGILFVLVGTAAAVILLLENPSLCTATLLVIAIWCFCRAYYFAFYVIEKYVDPTYRFSGLGSFLKYMLSRPARPPAARD